MARPLDQRTEDWLSSLIPRWRSWLSARHGRIGAVHEDLVQQAATDLIEWLGERAADAETSEALVAQVGFTILKRRVADHFRDRVRRLVEVPADGHAGAQGALQEPADDADPQALLERAQLLRVLVGLLSELPPEDRALLVNDELLPGSVQREALSAAQRKRVSRLRARLRDLVDIRLGGARRGSRGT